MSHLAAPARPSRSPRGAVRLEVVGMVALVAMLGVAALVGVITVRDENVALPPPREAVSCLPTAGRPGPLVDLAVDAMTGRDDDPVQSPSRVGALVGLAEQAGAGVIGVRATWQDLHPDPYEDYTFDSLDVVVDAARAAGLKVRVQLVGMPKWAQDIKSDTDYRPPLTGDELARWNHFIKDVVDHLDGRADYLEVWDEPNTERYWATGPDPGAFARLLAATRHRLDLSESDLVLVTGGLAGNDIGYLERMYDGIARLESDGELEESPFDMVGVHPFSGDLPPGVVAPDGVEERDPFGAYDENFTGFRSLHQVMGQHGDTGKDLYLSAFGYSTEAHDDVAAVSDETRAGYLTEAFRAATCSPYVAALSWYGLYPSRDVSPGWSILDARLEPTQTYASLTDWHELVTEAG